MADRAAEPPWVTDPNEAHAITGVHAHPYFGDVDDLVNRLQAAADSAVNTSTQPRAEQLPAAAVGGQQDKER